MICLAKTAKPYSAGGTTGSGSWHIVLKRTLIGSFTLCGFILKNTLLDIEVGSRRVTCKRCRKTLLKKFDEEDILIWNMYRSGDSVREIAEELGLGERAVFSYLERAIFIVELLEGIDSSSSDIND